MVVAETSLYRDPNAKINKPNEAQFGQYVAEFSAFTEQQWKSVPEKDRPTAKPPTYKEFYRSSMERLKAINEKIGPLGNRKEGIANAEYDALFLERVRLGETTLVCEDLHPEMLSET